MQLPRPWPVFSLVLEYKHPIVTLERDARERAGMEVGAILLELKFDPVGLDFHQTQGRRCVALGLLANSKALQTRGNGVALTWLGISLHTRQH